MTATTATTEAKIIAVRVGHSGRKIHRAVDGINQSGVHYRYTACGADRRGIGITATYVVDAPINCLACSPAPAAEEAAPVADSAPCAQCGSPEDSNRHRFAEGHSYVAPGAPAAVYERRPAAVPAAATRDEVTATVTAPARFAAVREDGRYRVVTTGVGAAAPGRVVATCSSKAKAEEKAAKLNADLAADLAEAPTVIADTAKLTEEQAATITRNPVGAVADAIRSGHTDFLGTVGELLGGATLDQIAARQAAAAQAAEDAKVTEAIANAVPNGEAAPAEDKPVNVYVGASVAELIIPRRDDADATIAAVARKLADRQPNAQNYRHVKLSAAERGALAGVATAIENDATTAGQGLLARAARTLRARIAATD